jgi:hypothetical protein
MLFTKAAKLERRFRSGDYRPFGHTKTSHIFHVVLSSKWPTTVVKHSMSLACPRRTVTRKLPKVTRMATREDDQTNLTVNVRRRIRATKRTSRTVIIRPRSMRNAPRDSATG